MLYSMLIWQIKWLFKQEPLLPNRIVLWIIHKETTKIYVSMWSFAEANKHIKSHIKSFFVKPNLTTGMNNTDTFIRIYSLFTCSYSNNSAKILLQGQGFPKFRYNLSQIVTKRHTLWSTDHIFYLWRFWQRWQLRGLPTGCTQIWNNK